MNILMTDWHEPLIYNIAKIPHTFSLLESKALGILRIDGKDVWQTSYRPLPKNVRTIESFEELRRNYQQGKFDAIIGLTYFDLAFYSQVPLPKLYLPISSFRDDLGVYHQLAPVYQEEIYNHIRDLQRHFFLSFMCKEMKEKEFEGPDSECYVFEMGTVFDPSDYGGYTGEKAEALRVGHLINERSYYNYALQKQVLEGIPHLLLGRNPGVPNSRPSESWDDLKNCLRTYRVFIATYAPDYNLTDPQAQIEAMASGMPIITTPHPLCLIEDGVSGYVSSDPEVLREKVLLLLSDRELAVRLGQNARKKVFEIYSLKQFQADWEKALQRMLKKQPLAQLPAASKGPSVELEGPFIYTEPFGGFNRKLLQWLNQKISAVFPISREPVRSFDAQNPHFVDALRVLEILGGTLAKREKPTSRLLTPFNQRYSPLPNERESQIDTRAYFYWDQGAFPESWKKSAEQFSEIWVGSSIEKQFYSAQGIPFEKLASVPFGIDPSDTNPSGEIADLPVKDKFVFVFAGNTLFAEGGDAALSAYINEFRKGENVSLLLLLTTPAKDLISQIEILAAAGQASEIYCYHLPATALYQHFFRIASCALVSHRGLAFPKFLGDIVASALPAAINGYGASGELAELGTPYFIPSEIQYIKKDNFTEPLVGHPFLTEPDPAYLRRIMRYAFLHPLQTKIRGLIGRRRILETRSWEQVGNQILKRISDSAPHSDSEKHGSLEALFREHEGRAAFHKASLHLLFEEWALAEEHALKSISINPDDLAAQSAIALAQAALGKTTWIDWYEKAGKTNHPAAIANLVKAAIYSEKRNWEPDFFGGGYDTHSQFLALLALSECGQSETATRLSRQLTDERNDGYAYAILGLLVQNFDKLEALSCFEQAAERDGSLAFLADRGWAKKPILPVL